MKQSPSERCSVITCSQKREKAGSLRVNRGARKGGEPRRRGGRLEYTEAFQRFRGALGMGAHLLRPRHPEGKE